MSKRRRFNLCLLWAGSFCALAGCEHDRSGIGRAGLGAAETPRAPSARHTAELKGRATTLPGIQVQYGAVVRGPRDRKRIALVFTAHEFGESGDVILKELERHKARASFFLTGDFVRNPAFAGFCKQLRASKHQVGPHSDKHLLYCSWDRDRRTLITQREFESDLKANIGVLQANFPGRLFGYLLPPYEHYNQQIVAWAQGLQFTLINFTPGTRSTADYTGEADRNFASSKEIFESIVTQERRDPDGLNGVILLLHAGAGPARADKFHSRFGELLDYLAGKGYEFVTVEELLQSQSAPEP